MADPKYTYILAPTRRTPPDGPIYLGSAISSPSQPEESLITVPSSAHSANPSLSMPHPAPLAAPIVPPLGPFNSVQPDWTATRTCSSHTKLGVFAQFLQVTGLGGDQSVSHSRQNVHSYKTASLETRWFNPTPAYCRAVVENEGVKDYIGAQHFLKPVYLVTGVMIARGASVLTSHLREKGVYVQLGFDGTQSGVPVTVGPKTEHVRRTADTDSFDNGSDFVLAYRLTKIKVGKFKRPGHARSIATKRWVKGALFDADRSRFGGTDDDEEEDEGELLIEQQHVDAEEAAGVRPSGDTSGSEEAEGKGKVRKAALETDENGVEVDLVLV